MTKHKKHYQRYYIINNNVNKKITKSYNVSRIPKNYQLRESSVNYSSTLIKNLKNTKYDKPQFFAQLINRVLE